MTDLFNQYIVNASANRDMYHLLLMYIKGIFMGQIQSIAFQTLFSECFINVVKAEGDKIEFRWFVYTKVSVATDVVYNIFNGVINSYKNSCRKRDKFSLEVMQTKGMLPQQLFAYQYPDTVDLLEFIRMSDYVEAAAGSFITHNYIQKLAQEDN